MLASWFNFRPEDDSDATAAAAAEAASSFGDEGRVDMSKDQRDQTAALLRSVLEFCRELIVNVWNTSPRIFDEVQKLVSQIGYHPQITQLYDLFFDVDGWLEAIEPFTEVVTVSRVFNWRNYVLCNRLDQLVYDILVDQNLLCAYELYEIVATAERLAMLTPAIRALQCTKQFARMDQHRLARLANSLKSEILDCGAKNFHALTFALLTMIDATAIRHLGQRYAKVVSDSTDDLADCLQKVQETIAAAAAATGASASDDDTSRKRRRRSEDKEEETNAHRTDNDNAATASAASVRCSRRKRRRRS